MYEKIGWEKVKIGDLVNSVSENNTDKDKPVILINTSDVLDGKVLNHERVKNENLKGQFKKSFRANDILFSEIRPKNGRNALVNFMPENYIASTKLMVLRPKHNNLNVQYLYYLLTSKDSLEYLQSIAESRSGTFPQITFSTLSEIEIGLPKLDEQKKIANLLSSLDDKIENNNAIIANLEEQAQTIFKSWFVDFEPFQDDEFKDSEMGRIPKEYMIQNLETISSIQTGFAFKSKDYQIEGTKVIRTLNIKDNFLDGSEYVYLPNFFYANKKYMKQRLQQFDTLLVMVGATIGKTGMVLSKDVPSLQNQNMWRFRPLDGKCSPIFVHYVVKLVNSMVTGWASGSARGFYRKDIFSKQKVVVPNEKWMGKFNQITIKLFELIENLKKQNIKLVEIRDTLLPKLMSGEIRVGEVVTEE